VTDALEIIRLTKKISLAEMRLRASEAETTEIKQRIASWKKAEAALMKFYARGPRTKKKSGRPRFWKGPHGLFFVQEVEKIKKERKCKTVTAIRDARKEITRRSKLAKAYGIKSDPIIAMAAILAKQKHNELQVRYQEARKFWFFLIDPEAYCREEAALHRNFEQAIAALREITRNPYDFS
jgi:hypothetical protein